MKTTINENEGVRFPCLMKSNQGRIILFLSENKGLLLNGEIINEGVHYSEDWDIKFFKPFYGEVILSND